VDFAALKIDRRGEKLDGETDFLFSFTCWLSVVFLLLSKRWSPLGPRWLSRRVKYPVLTSYKTKRLDGIWDGPSDWSDDYY
jgi:hypothetical protein